MEIEVWKPVARCSLYEISNLGRVRRITYKAHYINSNGYPAMQLWRGNSSYTTVPIHRLIAEAFLPNPENLPQVDHVNGNRADFRLDNLEWVTGDENQRRSWRKGERENPRGEKHGNAKLTAPQVHCIRAFRGLWRQRSMARHFGVSQHTIMYVLTGRGWRHAAGTILPPLKLKKLTDDDVREIRRLRETKNQTEIAAYFGLDPSTVSQILAGKRRRKVL